MSTQARVGKPWLEHWADCPSTVRAKRSVQSFAAKHGFLGQVALEVFSTVDPFHCFYGWDCNSDEYLGYAERFVANFTQLDQLTDRMQNGAVALDYIRAAVRRSFHLSQLAEKWVSEEDIEGISIEIQRHGVKMSAEKSQVANT